MPGAQGSPGGLNPAQGGLDRAAQGADAEDFAWLTQTAASSGYTHNPGSACRVAEQETAPWSVRHPQESWGTEQFKVRAQGEDEQAELTVFKESQRMPERVSGSCLQGKTITPRIKGA